MSTVPNVYYSLTIQGSNLPLTEFRHMKIKTLHTTKDFYEEMLIYTLVTKATI